MDFVGCDVRTWATTDSLAAPAHTKLVLLRCLRAWHAWRQARSGLSTWYILVERGYRLRLRNYLLLIFAHWKRWQPLEKRVRRFALRLRRCLLLAFRYWSLAIARIWAPWRWAALDADAREFTRQKATPAGAASS